MDLQNVLNFLIGAVLAALGWFARQMWDAVAALREDIRSIERDLPMHYVRRDDFLEAMRRIEDMVGKIFDKLDGKQANKQQASNLLSATDWTAIPSVADPAQSNPYLANQPAFLEYRNQLRAIAVNPLLWYNLGRLSQMRYGKQLPRNLSS